MKKAGISFLFLILCIISSAQDDTTSLVSSPGQINKDSALRIINLNPFFSVHVDSTLTYQFQINKDISNYYFYLRNAPVGLRINKDNGLLSFKADKSYFLSGRLKYDYNYKVNIGVQDLSNSLEKADTSFTVVFFNTEIIPSKLKPAINGTVWIEEGDTLRFKVLCETGNFPFENIYTFTSIPIGSFTAVQQCNDQFVWSPSYDFVKETDTGKIKSFTVSFIGSTKFRMQDTAQLRIIVKNGLDYSVALEQYKQVVHDMSSYILKLKFTFFAIR